MVSGCRRILRRVRPSNYYGVSGRPSMRDRDYYAGADYGSAGQVVHNTYTHPILI